MYLEREWEVTRAESFISAKNSALTISKSMNTQSNVPVESAGEESVLLIQSPGDQTNPNPNARGSPSAFGQSPATTGLGNAVNANVTYAASSTQFHFKPTSAKSQEKQKRDVGPKESLEERDKVRVVEATPSQSLLKRLQLENEELRGDIALYEREKWDPDPAGLESENRKLQFEIADLRRGYAALQDEVVSLRAVDVSILENFKHAALTHHEEHLIAVVNKLSKQNQELRNPHVPADFQPSNDSERELMAQINRLKVANNHTSKDQRAILDSLRFAEAEKAALEKEKRALLDTNIEVQNRLRYLETTDLRDVQARIGCLEDDKRALQRTNQRLRESRLANTEDKGIQIEVDTTADFAQLSLMQEQLDQAKRESELYQSEHSNSEAALKAQREEYEAEKERWKNVLLGQNGRLSELGSDVQRLSGELQSAQAENTRLQESDSRDQEIENLNQRVEELLCGQSDALKSALEEKYTAENMLSLSEDRCNQLQTSKQEAVECLEGENNRVNEELHTLKTQTEGLIKEKGELEETVARIQATIDKMHKDLEQANNDRTSMQSRLAEANLEAQRAKAAQGAQEAVLVEARSRITSLMKHEDESVRLRRQLEQATQDLAQANAAKDAANQKLAGTEGAATELQKLEQSYRDLKSAHETCQAQYADLQNASKAKIDKAGGILDERQKELDGAKTRIQDSVKELKRMEEEITRLQKQIAELQATSASGLLPTPVSANSNSTAAQTQTPNPSASATAASASASSNATAAQTQTPSLSHSSHAAQSTPSASNCSQNNSIPAQSTSSNSAASQNWLSSGRQTLGSARVSEELARAAGAEINRGRSIATRYALSNAIALPRFPWGNHKPSRFTKEGQRMRNEERMNVGDYEMDDGTNESGSNGPTSSNINANANSQPSHQNYAEGSADDEYDGDDEKGERDDHLVLRQWQRMGKKRIYTSQEQNNNRSKLARGLILTCLGTKRLFEAFSRDKVDDLRLQNFLLDADAGPKLRNSRLDKRGATVPEMLDKSHWNQTLMHKLADEAAAIYKTTRDDRFGDEPVGGWFPMIRVRIRPILKADLESRPLYPGEPMRDRIKRMADHYLKIKEDNRQTNILHTKFHVRAASSAIMTTHLRLKGSIEELQMWQYALTCIGILGSDGMSDEEDGTEEVTIHGEKTHIQVRKVMPLRWRHPSFRRLFELIDRTREVEASIFSRQGRPPLKRIRVDENPARTRVPPKHLPAAFFNSEYLEDLAQFPYQIDDLQMSKEQFVLYEVSSLAEADEQ